MFGEWSGFAVGCSSSTASGPALIWDTSDPLLASQSADNNDRPLREPCSDTRCCPDSEHGTAPFLKYRHVTLNGVSAHRALLQYILPLRYAAV